MTKNNQLASIWKFGLLALVLALAFAFVGNSAEAASLRDGHEDGEVVEEADVAEEEVVVEETSEPDDLGLTLEYLTFLESAKAGNDNLITALDQVHAGNTRACDTIIDGLNWSFILEAAVFSDPFFTPAGFDDINTLALEAMGLIGNGLTDIGFVCRNGVSDSITDFQYAYASQQLRSAQTKLYGASRAGAERVGVQVEPIVELLDLLNELFAQVGGPWTEAIFETDVAITAETLSYMAGWLDRALAGETVYCLEYMYYYFFLEPAIFDEVPTAWRGWYNEHVEVIDLVNDTSRDLFLACDSLVENPDGNVSDFVLGQARQGIAQAIDRTHRIQQQFGPQ